MDSPSGAPRDLSALAPPSEVDEVISSWLVRTADAHLLTISELEHEIGGSIAALDRGDLSLLPRLSVMLRIEIATLSGMVLPHFIEAPARSGRPPPHCWCVCRSCLEGDREQGRAPYVRQVWTDPLSVYCLTHKVPLVPHGNSEIKIASDLTLFNGKSPKLESRDIYLNRTYFDDDEMISYVGNALSSRDESHTHDLPFLRCAVCDIVDALATNMRTPNMGALISLVEKPMVKRRSLPGSNTMPDSWWSDVEARERLLYTRIALLFLAEPQSPTFHWMPSPFGRSWFVKRLCGTENIEWLRGAALDPLILMVMELPSHAISRLNISSLRWPRKLRQRWTYAVAAAALGRHSRSISSQPVAEF
ncbi:TniQ family protein [Caulobacter soli]|uniref:TniQ family protein n=1 Tax=Caulobacter soli TaxID=2708539 RepID=UPI0013EAF002